LEKEMATHSSILAWRIPGTVEPDGLLSMGSQQQQDKCLDAGLCWEEVMIPSLFPAEGVRVHGEEASLGAPPGMCG